MKRLTLPMLLLGVGMSGAQAQDFGVPADDNALLPSIDPSAWLTDLASGYADSGEFFDITAPPNDAGILNGVTYGPTAYGGVPGGATGWINSAYNAAADGTYGLAFWVSDVSDTVVNSALAIDNVLLPGASTEADLSTWTFLGSGGLSMGDIVLPTEGPDFAFIDTQNPLNDDPTLPPPVDTSIFGGTLGSVLLSGPIDALAGDLFSLDLNFLSNDGDGFNDFAVVQLFDYATLSVVPGTVDPSLLDGSTTIEEPIPSEVPIEGEIPEGLPVIPTQVVYDFDSAITLFTADSADPLIGLAPNIPVLPENTTAPDDGIWVFPETSVVPDVTWWFDPEYAVGYDYTVTGSTFTAIELPVEGDNCYNLIVAGVVYHDCDPTTPETELLGGVLHDLTDISPTGLSALTVTGIEISAALDPNDPLAFVTGFQFASAGNVVVTQAPITVFVPAPGTLFLAGAGLLGLMACRRKKQPRLAGAT